MIDSDPDTTESGAERQSSADAGLESKRSPRGEQGSSPHCDLTEAARPEETAAETKVAAGKGGRGGSP